MQNMKVGDIVKDQRDGKRYVFSWFDVRHNEAHLTETTPPAGAVGILTIFVKWPEMILHFEGVNPAQRMSQR